MSSRELTRGCRLEIELQDVGRRRTVTLDFRDHRILESQLEQLQRVYIPQPGRLLEFTNEGGEMLAVLAKAYVGHTVTPL
jgi:hypothetical protein